MADRRAPYPSAANMEVMPDVPEQSKLEAEIASFLKGYSSEMDKLMKTYDANGRRQSARLLQAPTCRSSDRVAIR